MFVYFFLLNLIFVNLFGPTNWPFVLSAYWPNFLPFELENKF